MHPEILRSYYHWQTWCPCKRSRSKIEVTEFMIPFSRFRTVTPVWFEMMHKAWHSIEEVPYCFCFLRSFIKFQGHRGWLFEDLNPIWVRLLGRSQLSNPSDLPCFSIFNFCQVPAFSVLSYSSSGRFIADVSQTEFSHILFISLIMNASWHLALFHNRPKGQRNPQSLQFCNWFWTLNRSLSVYYACEVDI